MAKKSVLAMKYTPKEWEIYAPALRSLSQDTVELARAVLVDGTPPIEIARRLSTSRQRVALAAKRVNERLAEHHASHLVPITVWVKPDNVEALKDQVLLEGGHVET
ncbi:TrfB-related DNA-binding protein [Halomonas sp. 3D7M]|uniref:TrfB-related DNA-binding protein n=1 Tax=Halomonas sp. 3D7M TaxID=2742617 RepID=UPI0018689984|nr:TrfB-related DNA-binding protein [Halomonas sp. 3D7M]